LREREAVTGAHTPVIAMTAFAMKGDAERFLAAGFDGYVNKPLQVKHMIAEMRRVIAASPPRTESRT
ncbi:MAG: response regulator, partial [Gemmatimonadetes bacterium]|nr:response regulator [Gemmatimonadota bacterium]